MKCKWPRLDTIETDCGKVEKHCSLLSPRRKGQTRLKWTSQVDVIVCNVSEIPCFT